MRRSLGSVALSASAEGARRAQATVYLAQLEQQLTDSRRDCEKRLRERDEYFTLQRFEDVCLSLAEILEATPAMRLENIMKGV